MLNRLGYACELIYSKRFILGAAPTAYAYGDRVRTAVHFVICTI